MKVLFIGGTGNISGAVSRLAIDRGIELWHLNRGARECAIPGVQTLHADIHDEAAVLKALGNRSFDAVVDWIAFTTADIDRDIRLFAKRTAQFVFISSASAYRKPPQSYLITEKTPLDNPFWEYSRNKKACEERLISAFEQQRFPTTIVRPSLTYDTVFPVAIGGWSCFTLVDRMRREAPVISHGDGTSLWVITHAEDFAKGFIGLLGNKRAIGEAFHITSDEVLTWDQIYTTIADAAGTNANIVHIPTDFIVKCAPQLTGSLRGDKSWSTVFDNSKIKAFVPGFKATISFAEGMKRTIAWFEADKKRMRIDAEVNKLMDGILAKYEEIAG
jgi:nucleoside-diphosphate-sugar epimerase